MSRPARWLAVALLVCLAAPAAAPGASRVQTFFRATLLEDERTTSAVKRLLRDRGFVVPDVTFADITGDGRTDAIVRVSGGGSAGAVAVYVFSTHALRSSRSDALRAVFRNQRLYRAAAQAGGGGLVLRTPRYAAGDDLCCPGRLLERTYTWSTRRRTLVRRATREVDAPTAATVEAPVNAEAGGT